MGTELANHSGVTSVGISLKGYLKTVDSIYPEKRSVEPLRELMDNFLEYGKSDAQLSINLSTMQGVQTLVFDQTWCVSPIEAKPFPALTIEDLTRLLTPGASSGCSTGLFGTGCFLASLHMARGGLTYHLSFDSASDEMLVQMSGEALKTTSPVMIKVNASSKDEEDPSRQFSIFDDPALGSVLR